MLGWLSDMRIVFPLSKPLTRPRQAGFTLVEVLVAISIIGIMASLLLPAVAKSKIKTKRIQCLGNLAQIGKALYMYGNDHDGRLPWQILPSDQKVELGSGWDDFTMDPGCHLFIATNETRIRNSQSSPFAIGPGTRRLQ
jgi:prepilin-type N-terminal cleavage/methylation domain-containing protein